MIIAFQEPDSRLISANLEILLIYDMCFLYATCGKYKKAGVARRDGDISLKNK